MAIGACECERMHSFVIATHGSRQVIGNGRMYIGEFVCVSFSCRILARG